jgi:hypothetical protein
MDVLVEVGIGVLGLALGVVLGRAVLAGVLMLALRSSLAPQPPVARSSIETAKV